MSKRNANAPSGDDPTGNAPTQVLWEISKDLEHSGQGPEEMATENILKDELDERGVSTSSVRVPHPVLEADMGNQITRGAGLREAWTAVSRLQGVGGATCPAPVMRALAARFPYLKTKLVADNMDLTDDVQVGDIYEDHSEPGRSSDAPRVTWKILGLDEEMEMVNVADIDMPNVVRDISYDEFIRQILSGELLKQGARTIANGACDACGFVSHMGECSDRKGPAGERVCEHGNVDFPTNPCGFCERDRDGGSTQATRKRTAGTCPDCGGDSPEGGPCDDCTQKWVDRTSQREKVGTRKRKADGGMPGVGEIWEINDSTWGLSGQYEILGADEETGVTPVELDWQEDDKVNFSYGWESFQDLINSGKAKKVGTRKTARALGDGWFEEEIEGPAGRGYYRAQAKVYAEGSQYGINGGPVSKLTVWDSSGESVYNYDRGLEFDNLPSGILDRVLAVFEPLSASDDTAPSF